MKKKKRKKKKHKPFPSSLALTCHQPVNKQDDTVNRFYSLAKNESSIELFILIHAVPGTHAVNTHKKKLVKKIFSIRGRKSS